MEYPSWKLGMKGLVKANGPDIPEVMLSAKYSTFYSIFNIGERKC